MDNKQPDPDVIGGEADLSEDKGVVIPASALLDRAANEETEARTQRPDWMDPNGGPDEPDPEYAPDDPMADQDNWPDSIWG